MAAIAFALTSLPAGAVVASPISAPSEQTSSNDLGVLLVEVFAQAGDLLTFYLDQLASEAYLPTGCDANC